MTTAKSIRNFQHGMACERCGDMLIAPEGSEYVSERLVLNLWSCAKCSHRFETEACVPVDAESENDRVAIEAFFPSLLVA